MPLTLILKISTINTKALLKIINDFIFMTPKAKLPFLRLRQVFTRALIFYYFNLEHYIWIEINATGYIIYGVFSQLTL